MSNVQQSNVDEQTALLSDPQADVKCIQTPIPKLQLAIVLLLQACELFTRNAILPYINQVHLLIHAAI